MVGSGQDRNEDKKGLTMSIDIDRETINIPQVAKILGISAPVAYQLAREDRLPAPVIKLGRRLVVSRRALEAVLDRRHDESRDQVA